MSYLVLARKWRPKYFDEVVGQDHVARTLKNSLAQDRVAHAHLFCGTRGVGKTTTARILAKALNCVERPTPRPCYECASCTEIHEGQSVDVFEIDGASNRGINEIRELREGVRYAPSRDRFKIYIIDEVHMLTNEAFNALLKTLEEPPEHAHFIFATTEPQKIPVTILSRCQRFDFKRISQNDIVDHLVHICDQEDIAAERAALQLIARQANGGMRDALSLVDQVISFAGEAFDEAQVAQILGVANRKHLFELSEAIVDRDAEAALAVLDEVNRYGYDLGQFGSELVSHFRDLVVTAVVDNPERVTNLTESELDQTQDQVAGVASDLLHRYFTVMADGAQEMARSPYPKLIFEMTLVRMAQLEPLDSLGLMVDRLESLEGVLEGDVDVGALEPSGEAKKKTSPTPEPITPEPMTPESAAPESTAPDPPAADQHSEGPDTAADGGHAVAADDPSTDDRNDRQELLDASPRDRWRALVSYLTKVAAPVAGTCKHARLRRFDDGELVIELEPRYMKILRENDRARAIEDALAERFGPAWSLDILEEAPADTAADAPSDAADLSESSGAADASAGQISTGQISAGQTSNDDPSAHNSAGSTNDHTLYEEHEARRAERKQTLKRALEDHPLVQEARRRFDPEYERVAVRLDDDVGAKTN